MAYLYNYVQTKELTEVDRQVVAPCMVPIVDSVVRTFRCKVGVHNLNLMITPETPLHFFYDDCPLGMGTVGFDEIRKKSSEPVFYVLAPTITNERYAECSTQYHMATSAKPLVAIQNTKRYLRRPNAFNCADYFWREKERRVFDTAKHSPKYNVKVKADNISKNDEVLRELEIMHRAGHTFQSLALAQDVREWVEAKDEESYSALQRSSRAAYIYVKPDGSVDGCTFDAHIYSVLEDNGAEPLHEISEEMRGRVAALSMCEDGCHVDLVGTRIANNCFFVYV